MATLPRSSRAPRPSRWLAAVLALAPASAAAFAPTSSYETRTVRGFTVLVSPDVRAQPDQEADVLGFLDLKLGEIEGLLPAPTIQRLQAVKIWIEWQEEPTQGSTYNPSAQWLTAHGRNPEKAKGVEVTNLRHFVDWGRTDQPMNVLHELSHAYHDQVLGQDYRPIIDAYRNAQQLGLYASVPYVHGGSRRAYALNNKNEFFAELSEAYFGRNDFYPFTRDDLRRYDPVGFRLMRQAWGR